MKRPVNQFEKTKNKSDQPRAGVSSSVNGGVRVKEEKRIKEKHINMTWNFGIGTQQRK